MAQKNQCIIVIKEKLICRNLEKERELYFWSSLKWMDEKTEANFWVHANSSGKIDSNDKKFLVLFGFNSIFLSGYLTDAQLAGVAECIDCFSAEG